MFGGRSNPDMHVTIAFWGADWGGNGGAKGEIITFILKC